MNSIPLISIIVASYNYQEYISETLESLVAQTYSHFEVIVDDGSQDNSVAIIKEFETKDHRIKLYQHENGMNKGLSNSIIFALEQAQGAYIAFCESDDSWRSDHLQIKVDYLNKFPEADVIVNYPNMFGDSELISYKTLQFYPFFRVLRKIKKPQNMFMPIYTKGNNMTFATFSIVMVKVATLKACNFDTPQLGGLDVWLWKQLIAKYIIGYVDERITNWRLHKQSYTHGHGTSTIPKRTSRIKKEKSASENTFFQQLEAYTALAPEIEKEKQAFDNKKRLAFLQYNRRGINLVLFKKMKIRIISAKMYKYFIK